MRLLCSLMCLSRSASSALYISDALEHLLGDASQYFWAQTTQVLDFEVRRIKHVHSVPRPAQQGHSGMR